MDTRHSGPALLAALLLIVVATPAAATAPPSTSPYATDTSNVYVQDATSDGLAGLNMVLCVIKGLGAGAMLTAHGTLDANNVTGVRYNALVDKARCDNASLSSASNSSTGASGASSTPAYINAVVDVTRGAGASDPMVAKVWMNMSADAKPVTIWAKLSATADPATKPPYGTMHLDYAGYSNGTMQFDGFIDADGGAVTHVETSGGSGNGGDVALLLNATSASAGNGVIRSPDRSMPPGSAPRTYVFQYTDAAFARNDGTGDLCFDRSRANAQSSVWSYGIYDAGTGERVDLAHPGFPISATTASALGGIPAGTTEYGFAGYWGVNFGGIDGTVFGALADGEVTAFSNIQDQRSGHTATYRMYKDSGKLTRWTQNQTTLGALNGIPLMFFGEGCRLVNGASALTQAASVPSPSGLSQCTGTAGNGPDFQTWIMQWDSTAAGFKIVGMQKCSQGSGMCLSEAFTGTAGTPSPATVLEDFKQQPINAWSEALGNVVIPIPPGDTMAAGGSAVHADADPAYYYSQATVLPSAASPLDLYCLGNCPTAASLAAYATSGGSPFTAQTAMQWGAGANEVHYRFDDHGLVDDAQGHVVMPAGAANGTPGAMSGRMYAADLAATTTNGASSCPMGAAYCEPSAPTEYYTYQTGPNQWNQTIWLTSGGAAVTFDPPQYMAFDVPTGAAYGSWAGKRIQLQYNGFGNVNGIPGTCVDPLTNAVQQSCTPSSRFVAAFSLPDGTPLSLAGRSVLSRALNAELRLAPLTCPPGLSTTGLTLTAPTTQPHDPSQSTDTTYIGTAPTVTTPPAVIDGVVQ